MEKKILHVSAAVCDARKVRESTLEGYEKIVINAALLLVTAESRALLARYPVTVDAVATVELAEEAKFSVVSGMTELRPGMALSEEGTFLMVNGALVIYPGCEEVLARYSGGLVNGKVLCPESMAALLGKFQVNGKLTTYPDGCILLDRTAVLDGLFHLRAREGERYFAEKKVVALDGKTDFDKLAEKGVGFVTEHLLVSEALAEKAAPLFDRRCKVTLLPDGCAYVEGDAMLDEAFLARKGPRAYVEGSLTLGEEGGALLDRVEYLRCGLLKVAPALAEKVRAMPALEYGELRVMGGKELSDRPVVTLDAALLEGASEGVSVEDCGKVVFAEDVPAELIREKVVSIRDCGKVVCNAGQRPAVEERCSGVGKIAVGEEPSKAPGGEDIVRLRGVFYTL